VIFRLALVNFGWRADAPLEIRPPRHAEKFMAAAGIFGWFGGAPNFFSTAAVHPVFG